MGLSGTNLPSLCPLPAPWLQRNFSLLGLPQVPRNKFNQRSEKIQEQRKTVKQDKSDGLAIKVEDLQFLLKGSRQYSEPNPFKCFAATEPPTRQEKLTVCCPQAHRFQTSWNQKVDDVDSRLPHHQPIRRVSTRLQPSPSPCLYKPFPESHGEFGPSELSCPEPFAWCPAINTARSFTTTWCQQMGLIACR